MVSRVALFDSVSEVLYIEVGIHLGGGEFFVSEQLLYDTQVCAVLQQVGGKGVPQGVWRDGFLYACRGAEAFDDGEYHGAGQLSASAIEKSGVLILGFYIPLCAVLQPVAEPLVCGGRYGYEALLAAFAPYYHIAFAAVDVRQAQVGQFAYA